VRKLKTFFIICKLDAKHNVYTSETFSLVLLWYGMLWLLISKKKAAANLMRSHRNTRKVNRKIFLERLMARWQLFDPDIIDSLLPEFDPGEASVSHDWISQIKEPSGEEKGVALVMFNDAFEKLRAEFDIAHLLEDYYLVLEPSCSGYCIPEILQFIRYSDAPVIVQSSEVMDFDFLNRLNSNFIPVDYGASDWNDDRVFIDMKMEKIYDCCYVAMWNDVKRHHALFRAVAGIGDPNYRVALAGASWNMSTQDVRDLAAYYGIEDNIVILEGYRHPRIREVYNQSKVQVLMSIREGSNKTIFEGFFCNVPGIVLANNVGVNKTYVNKQTGKLVDEKDLTDTLAWFREHYREFQPRQWAMDNISCLVTTAKLEKLLSETARARGEKWVTPIAVKVNRGSFPRYYDSGEEFPQLDTLKYRRTALGTIANES